MGARVLACKKIRIGQVSPQITNVVASVNRIQKTLYVSAAAYRGLTTDTRYFKGDDLRQPLGTRINGEKSVAYLRSPYS